MCLHKVSQEITLEKDMVVKKLCTVIDSEVSSYFLLAKIKKGVNRSRNIKLNFYKGNGEYTSGYHCYSKNTSNEWILNVWDVSRFGTKNDKVVKFTILKGIELYEKYVDGRSKKFKKIVYVTPVLIYNPKNC